MRVGLLTVSFRLPAVASRKERRSLVRRILTDVHNSGPAFGVCEIPDDGDLRCLTIRVGHLSTDGRFTDAVLRRLTERFEHKGEYEVLESSIEIL
mgnify:CR=1 FL=1